MNQKFHLGQVVVTRGVSNFASIGGHIYHPDIGVALMRHASGDWGEVCDEDKQANEQALINGDRLLSAYDVMGKRIWIITEYDRSLTTILFPDEY